MKEIKDIDLFYVRNIWFRDLIFFSSFYRDWLNNIHNKYLNSKYYVVRQMVNDRIDYQWLIHGGEVTHYNLLEGNYYNGTFKTSCLTELLMHFDVNFPEGSCHSRRVYEATEKEFNNIRMAQELLR